MNLFAALPSELPQEVTEKLVQSKTVRIERIISRGHVSPAGFWYDQPEREWVVLLQGAARLRRGDELIEMRPGDFVDLAAHERHRVEWTPPDQLTVWLAVFYDE
jgi:cupin 2 domain-containing protein